MAETRKSGFRKFRLLLTGIALTPVILFIIFILLVWSDMPDLGIIENPQNDLSSQIISSDGQVIRSLYDEKHRISVPLSQMSPHLLNALIALSSLIRLM